MARPSGFDHTEAIETAMQELWRHGYEASSVKAISEKLGITRSSYYNAFGTREALFKKAVAAYAGQSPDRVLYENPSERPVLELLTRTFRAICRARATDPDGRGCLVVNSLGELGSDHEELGPFLVNVVLRSAARLEELLELAIQNGELPAGTDIHAKALALQNLMIGINTFSKALRSEDELWLTVKTTLEGLALYRDSLDAAP